MDIFTNGELLSLSALEQRARDLASLHKVSSRKGPDLLLPKLAANESLLRACNQELLASQDERVLSPAAEWLVDNFYLIEEQIRMVRRHLPRGFSRELPHLTAGPCVQHPRVYEIAARLITHVDGRIDREHLTRFIAAYQSVSPLKLGELWALPIMLRLALIDALRRISTAVNARRKDRALASQWVHQILDVAETNPAQLIVTVGDLARGNFTPTSAFVAEFWRLTQEKSPAFTLALGWIENRLAIEGSSVEQMVLTESHEQAANQVSVGNSISSLRFVDAMDWQEFVEQQSGVEKVLRTDPAAMYAQMDFRSRDAYRHVVERLARCSPLSEIDIAQMAVDLARRKAQPDGQIPAAHVGYYLVDRGLPELETLGQVRIPVWEQVHRQLKERPLAYYLGGIASVCVLTTVVMLWLFPPEHPSSAGQLCLLLLLLLCASQLGVGLVNWFATLLVRPRTLPRLDFSQGIPDANRVLVVVPTLLTSAKGIEHLIEGLEVHHLANRDENVFFALLTDLRDAAEEHLPGDDALIAQAKAGIESLNARYRQAGPSKFYLFHRPRRWNAQEHLWMGYERKRGKLMELNRALRGGGREEFSVIAGDLERLPHIRYVITLDTDTQLPRDSARQLAGSMAHVLNRAVYDPGEGRVVSGYGLLQPRVAVSLPSAGRSRFARLFAGDSGIDPYTRTVSDVYQDLFEEGSFIGKGIYDVDAFEAAVGGRFPENRILSHDLLEGCYARSGLIADVLLFEEFPSRYTADTRRRHRWIRGDWQIATWLLPRVPGSDVRRMENPLTGLSRWKIFDNLRRSLVPAGLVGLLVYGWLAASVDSLAWTGFVLALIALPGALAAVAELVQKPRDLPPNVHVRNVLATLQRQAGHTLLTLVFLPYDAFVSLDATLRTLGRLLFTHRRLLEWQTANEVEMNGGASFRAYLSAMWSAPAIAVTLGLLLWVDAEGEAWVSLPFLLLWLVAPAVGWWISQPPQDTTPALNPDQTRFLRQLARRTWAYFETYVGPADNWLPPDNFQEQPVAVLATRTSPTNLGMALLSTLAAWDFGHISTRQLTQRVQECLKTLGKLERFQGHFYNWYDTRTLKPLPPLYLSTVDNGNFSGLMLVLRAGLADLAANPGLPPKFLAGLADTLGILLETPAPPGAGAAVTGQLRSLRGQLENFSGDLYRQHEALLELLGLLDGADFPVAQEDAPEFKWWAESLRNQVADQLTDLEATCPWLKLRPQFEGQGESGLPPILHTLWRDLGQGVASRPVRAALAQLDNAPADWAETGGTVSSLVDRFRDLLQEALEVRARRTALLGALAHQCGALAEMDFGLLYDRDRELFSIGYNVASHRLDPSCYDLLASEARLTSFVAVALGQVPQEHWFTLGRLLTAVGDQPALISWSGSMFEYLMPPLVMPEYEHTLMDVSCRAAVARQIEYGQQSGTPWGISESGYNLTDAHSNYQYRAFGVPGLGFKRGLADELVIAPYASVMALLVAPRAACLNLERLLEFQALGRYGFYEAVDFTAERRPPGRQFAVVQSFMAHHQGMSLLALASRLLDRPMQRRFQSVPEFKAAEMLLQERMPRATSFLYPHELESDRILHPAAATEPAPRVFRNPNSLTPEVHLLSNGRYHVMVTHAGGGYCRWNDTALTRWREDATRDCWGTFLYLRDRESWKFWSVAHQPTLQSGEDYEAIFSPGRAEFRTQLHGVSAHTEISVSPEDDVEVRRVTLTNHSDEPRTLEVTGYAEVVVNSQAADLAHTAFNKLFIQTELRPEEGAILCSRRPRARAEQPPWMFQLMLLQGNEEATVSFETDRARFLGRGRDLTAPAALQPGLGQLANSQGSVLDPVMAIRRSLRLEPKESASVLLVTGAAAHREAALGLVDKYQDVAIANRVFELAWTHGAVTLRQLNATEAQAHTFARLAGALIYPQAARRAPAPVLLRNSRNQRGLWNFGISGDLPILLLRATGTEQLAFVQEVLMAHAYWRFKGLTVDLVIINEDSSVYRQNVHDQIMGLVSAGLGAQMVDKPGGIFVRRGDQLSEEDRILLQASARVVLTDNGGPLAELLQRRVSADPPMAAFIPRSRPRPVTASGRLPERDLIFFNDVGGFTRDGREYVIQLPAEVTTPAPWSNVLSNPGFGTVITESGGAYSWSENCHEFRLTTWHNDPVSDLTGEAFYVRDQESGRFWSPMPLPARGAGTYVTRHGFGYSVFEHVEDGIGSETWVYVATDAPVKFVRVILRNLSDRERSLSLMGYWEWLLGELRDRNRMHVVTEFDARNGALLSRNAYNGDFPGRTAFVWASETPSSHTGDRAEFIGRNRTLSAPAALGRSRLSGRTGAALDPCAALQVMVRLAPGGEHEVVFKLGAARDRQEALRLIPRYRSVDAAMEALRQVWAHWNGILGAVQVETPDPAVNVLANGWLLYQTIACRLWARSGFYQSGGAFGFRDQLQDAMATVHARPGLLREQILLAAAHQFREGDVQHWWHPPTNRGVRTHFSDDYLWLPAAVARYVEMTGDAALLDVAVPFLEGRPVRPEEEAYYDQPQISAESAPLYEHCVRALRNGLRFGQHGLPLIGCGDWNDGMNLVGEHGKGESVWLAFFLFDVLKRFGELAGQRGDATFARLCAEQVAHLRQQVERQAWDGRWYRRAYFDDGRPLGSAENEECQIDALPQAWAVLSGLARPDRCRTALESVAHRLVRRDARLIQLFDPPFDRSSLEPGYIKGYVPGVRENGGQYTHAAVWTVMAFAELGEADRAWELFNLINPVGHADTARGMARYKAEPYVMAADVYSVSPHTGRGGWTWYTGSAGWTYRLILETLLGLQLRQGSLHFHPRLPSAWKSIRIDYRFQETPHHIHLLNQSGTWQGEPEVWVDGKAEAGPRLTLRSDRQEHRVEVRFEGAK
jgi:cyclic beta-1,2-glucan synthetase